MYRFMPSVLTRFLLRRFFAGFFIVMFTVCGIIFAVTFVERLSSNPTFMATLMDAWIRLLEYIPMFLPLAVFMGTLVTSYNLTKFSEMIIMYGAGMSNFQTTKPFLIGAFIIGAVTTTIINPYSVNLTTKNLTDHQLQLVDDAIWLRESSDNGYLTARASDIKLQDQNIVFKKTTLFIQDKDFKLQKRIFAQNAVLSDKGFDIPKADVIEDDGKIKNITKQHIDTKLTPQTILDRYLQPDQISFWKLPSFIKKMNSIGVITRGHLVQFWTLLFLPLTMIAMVTLGVAFSQTRQRRNYSFGIQFSLGIITCFALYFIVSIFNALGNTGSLPPLIAIIAPQLIIIAGSGIFITSFDTI